MEGGTAVGSVGTIVALSLLFGLVLGTTGVLGVSAVSPPDGDATDGFTAALDPFDDDPSTTDAVTTDAMTADPVTDRSRSEDSDTADGTATEERVPSFPRRSDSHWERLPHVEHRDPGHVTVETDRSSVDAEHVERYVADAIDDYRAANGLEPWSYSYALASTARGHSYDMDDRSFFAHENPDGEQAWDRWGRDDCRARFGENVAETYLAHAVRDADGDTRTYYTAQELAAATMELWKQSPSHDELLRATWPDAAGVGVFLGARADGGYVVYVTLNVCSADGGL